MGSVTLSRGPASALYRLSFKAYLCDRREVLLRSTLDYSGHRDPVRNWVWERPRPPASETERLELVVACDGAPPGTPMHHGLPLPWLMGAPAPRPDSPVD